MPSIQIDLQKRSEVLPVGFRKPFAPHDELNGPFAPAHARFAAILEELLEKVDVTRYNKLAVVRFERLQQGHGFVAANGEVDSRQGCWNRNPHRTCVDHERLLVPRVE